MLGVLPVIQYLSPPAVDVTVVSLRCALQAQVEEQNRIGDKKKKRWREEGGEMTMEAKRRRWNEENQASNATESSAELFPTSLRTGSKGQ